MYTNHWSLVNMIWQLCQQAQQLLEEANILTGRDFILQQEIETHMSRITKTKLCKRLHKPTHFCFKEMPLPPSQPAASSSRILTTCRHPVCYTWPGEPMRCYECNSLLHIKWNCQLYVCLSTVWTKTAWTCPKELSWSLPQWWNLRVFLYRRRRDQ